MGAHSYSKWLAEEVASSQLAILALLVQRDKLLYHDAPELRAEYMVKIGSFEEQVLAGELETRQLARKAELLQAAVNRREQVDLAMLEAQLEEERAALLEELEQSDLTSEPLPQLSKEENAELQKLYREIVQVFHPEMNPAVTQTQQLLYEQAVEAYRQQNLEALRLLGGMLYDPNTPELQMAPATKEDDEAQLKLAIDELSDWLGTDYSLAAKLFDSFEESESDLILRCTREKNAARLRELQAEITAILAAFPFNAKETLENESKRQAYLKELELRLHQSNAEQERLLQKIEQLTGAVQHG